MSTPSGGATSAPQCACTNISIMQLFHELKQQFPGVPDHVVSSTISSHCHDRSACQSRLECEAKNYISHLYPSSSLSSSRKEDSRDFLQPQQCPNQVLMLKEVQKAQSIIISTLQPQNAVQENIQYSSRKTKEYIAIDNDLNQNTLSSENVSVLNSLLSENPIAKSETTSPAVSGKKECENVDSLKKTELLKESVESCVTCVAENKSFKIIKSNKIKSELNRQLDNQNNKIYEHRQQEDKNKTSERTREEDTRLKRPTTLDFSGPGGHFQSQAKNRSQNDNAANGCKEKNSEDQRKSDDFAAENRNSSGDVHGRPDDSPYPLNVSVNLNCRMDMVPPDSRSRPVQFFEPWREDFSGPGSYTSVNLTVCTPTSSEKRNPRSHFNANSGEGRPRGFEGHVQITVSPASSHSGPQNISVTPTHHSHPYSAAPQVMTDNITSALDELVRRQKERLLRLESALAGERARLASMQREVSALRAPSPAPTHLLRPAVLRLRHLCQRLARQLDRAAATAASFGETDEEFYDNIYTGQRPSVGRASARGSSSWQCHICTFRNHALLNKCEECNMPRIILGREEAPLSLMPCESNKPSVAASLCLSNNKMPFNISGDPPAPERPIISAENQMLNSDSQVHAS